jgi:hypothetical protein
MGIGGSIFLIAVGLILALAVHTTISGIDVNTIGWILVAAGVLGLVLTMAIFMPRRRATRTETIVRTAPTTPGTVVPNEQVIEERRYTDGV